MIRKKNNITRAIMVLTIMTVFCYQGFSQDMYKQLNQWHEKFHPSVGAWGGGTGYGLEMQVYRGGLCSTGRKVNKYKKKETITLYAGMEEAAYKDELGGNPVLAGGIRIGGRITYPLFTSIYPNFQLYTGIGVEAGTHRLFTESGAVSSGPGWGLHIPIGLEYFLFQTTINRQQAILFTAFAEGRFYTEYNTELQYIKPTFGLRVSLFR